MEETATKGSTVGTATAEKTLLALADGMNDLPSTREETKRLSVLATANGWRTTALAGDDALFRIDKEHGATIGPHRSRLDDRERARCAWRAVDLAPF